MEGPEAFGGEERPLPWPKRGKIRDRVGAVHGTPGDSQGWVAQGRNWAFPKRGGGGSFGWLPAEDQAARCALWVARC